MWPTALWFERFWMFSFCPEADFLRSACWVCSYIVGFMILRLFTSSFGIFMIFHFFCPKCGVALGPHRQITVSIKVCTILPDSVRYPCFRECPVCVLCARGRFYDVGTCGSIGVLWQTRCRQIQASMLANSFSFLESQNCCFACKVSDARSKSLCPTKLKRGIIWHPIGLL